MGKKSKPAPPPTPDYAAAAKAQGQANIEAAQTQAALARFNQQTPFGSLEWMQDPGDPNKWTSTVTLSPEQQQLLDTQQQGQIGMGEAAVSMLPGLTDQLSQPLDTSGLPPWMSSIDLSGLPEIQTSLDFSSLPGVTGAEGFAEQQGDVRDALYRQSTQMMDPQFEQSEEAMRSRLANQGLMPGSEAFDREMDNFFRQRMSAYGDARDRAILAGGAEQSRLNRDSLAARNAMLAEILAGGQFANQAAGQAFGQRMTGETTQANLANAVRQSGLGEALTTRQLPLQEFLTMFGGAQPSLPDFQATQGVQGIEAAPLFGATQLQDQHAQNLYAQQMAARNNAISGLYGAVGAIPGMFSFGG